MKQTIKEVIVVEGKTDSEKLKQSFDVETIETSGLNVKKSTLELIKRVSDSKGIILFLDPDGPGERIRKICQENLINYKQAFIDRKNQNYKSKVGIAESSNEAIIHALENVVSFNKNQSSLTWDEYLSLNLDTKIKRKLITDYFMISESNNKQLFKRLNMMGVKIKVLKEIINGNLQD